MHPAIVPILEILKTSLTSALPTITSSVSGASMPSIAAFTSLIAS
jgi:hypothetical protein